jgi:hypothetical protein
MNSDFPARLRIAGRQRLSPRNFAQDDLLYRDFRLDYLNEQGEIEANTIRFPDLSCNWSRFSLPDDVKYRENGLNTDGCYSITVEFSRFQNIATPVHDLIQNVEFENYAHVEVRELKPEEDIFIEPPKGRKPNGKKAKKRRSIYRRHICQNLTVEFEPTA